MALFELFLAMSQIQITSISFPSMYVLQKHNILLKVKII